MRRSLARLAAGLSAVLLGLGLPTADATPLAAAPPGSSQLGTGQRPDGIRLPARWALTSDGSRLTWRAPAPIPILDAVIQVKADGKLLPGATVSADGRKVSVPTTDPIRDPRSLQVIAGGRRLDRKVQSSKSGSGSKKGMRSPSKGGAVPQSPTLLAASDPGTPGPYRTREGEYHLDDLRLDGWATPIEMQATVVAPVGAPKRRPMALFLHGRHATCYNLEADPESPNSYTNEMAWPCPTGWKPVPSYRGFRQTQELLASQGWITVSIGANAISAQDNGKTDYGLEGRSQLVQAHLSQWAAWSRSDAAWAAAPPAVSSGPRPDLGKVLLTGHSRGGAGVNRAALDTVTGPTRPWKIGGLLLLAPVSAGDPAPGVPTTVLMGACDGDIGDLEGQTFIDESRDITTDPALRSAIYLKGANHSYFNSEWTPGLATAPAADDWHDLPPDAEGTEPSTPDPDCSAQSSARLTATEQRAVGATYTAAAAQALVLHRNGPAALLDGSGVRAKSAGRAQVLSHALGARRQPLLRPSADTTISADASIRANLCAILDNDDDTCQDLEGSGYSPHFMDPMFRPRPRKALSMSWSAPGGWAHLGAGSPGQAGPVRLDPATTALSLRVVVPAQARDTSFDVGLSDAAGKRIVLDQVTMNGLTGDVNSRARFAWAQEVRVPIDRGALTRAGVDLTAVTQVEIKPRSATGKITVLDAWGYRPGLDNAAPVGLPRFDLPAELTVPEGDSDHTLDIPITISGQVTKPARISLSVWSTSPHIKVPDVIVAAGATTAMMHVPVAGNTLASLERRLRIEALGLNEIVGGQSTLDLQIEDDDPPPTVTITPTATAVEGTSLTWTLALSGPVAQDLVAEITFLPPTGGDAELEIGDLATSWASDNYYDGPLDVPLSKADANMFVTIPAGATTLEIKVPIAKDDLAEGNESARLALHDEPYMIKMPSDVHFEGKVTDS